MASDLESMDIEAKPESSQDSYGLWNGPDDPDNPRNWSTRYKAAQMGTVAWVSLLSPLASTIIAPGSAKILREFHVESQTVGSFITSIYLLGYVFGPLLIAPLSEIYGRRPVYHVSNVGFLVFNICCAVSPNIGALLAFRFFAGTFGTFGATAVTLGPATIGDLFIPQVQGKALAIFFFGVLFGPVIGPVCGGFLIAAEGWRWGFWLLSILSGVGVLVGFAFLRETYHDVLIRRRAAKNPSGEKSLVEEKNASQHLWNSAIRPLKMMILYPVTTGLVLYGAVMYGWLYLCFTTYPAVFQQSYGFSNAISGLVYLGFGVGAIIGVAFSAVFSDRVYKALGKKQGVSRPEHRLPLLVFGGLFVPIAFFWYGWSAEAKTQWIVPIIGTGFFGFGFVQILLSTSAYLITAYPQYAASANAVNTLIRSLFGALLPLAGPSLYGSLGIGWGNSLLAFITIAMLPISLVLYRYGEKMRSFKTWNGEL